MSCQSGILAPLTPHARYLLFSFESGRDEAIHAIKELPNLFDGEECVVGLGPSLLAALGKSIPGMRSFPGLAGPGVDIPATQYALWCWLRGTDRGELHLRSREIENALAMDFQLCEVLDAFIYDGGRDLTGYEDGTENPEGQGAVEAAIVQGQGPGLDGASFVAVQQWRHDMARFEHMSSTEQDDVIGRRRQNNEELDDAPVSAHVKRTAQESYTPEAFIVRRSMPWAEGNEAGLNFVAFGKAFDAFEMILRRMAGEEDDITDALFRFTRPVSGGYYWCPPISNGRLDLRVLSD